MPIRTHDYAGEDIPPDGRASWVTTSTEIWLEEELGSGWVLAVRLVPQGDTVIPAEVRVFPAAPSFRKPGRWSFEPDDTPAGGLPATILRDVRLTSRMSDARGLMRGMAEEAGTRVFDPDLGGVLGEAGFYGSGALQHHRAGRRPGRKGHPDEYFLPFIVHYVGAIASGSTSPIQDISEPDPGWPPARYVSEMIHEARRRGLLGPAPRPGVAGGELTDKARDIRNRMTDAEKWPPIETESGRDREAKG